MYIYMCIYICIYIYMYIYMYIYIAREREIAVYIGPIASSFFDLASIGVAAWGFPIKKTPSAGFPFSKQLE